MKVLVVSNMYPNNKFPSYGIFVKHFCDQLEELNISHSLSVMKKSANTVGKIRNYLHFYIGTFIKCVFFNYDLIYVHYASHSSVPVIAASKFRRLHIYTNVHGSDVVPENAKQEKMQKYTRKILFLSEKIITPSEYFKEFVKCKYEIPSNKMYVSHSGGINSNIFYKQRLNDREEGLFRIGFVSRISYGKGWNTILKACSLLKNQDYELIIVGNGPDNNLMQCKILELGLSSHIRQYDLLPQEQLREIYNEIDVFAFPTEREGESLGLVAIEAMACGTAVIASDFAAPAYYIVDGLNGFKFEKGNAMHMAEKLEAFRMLSQEERRKMEEGAIETAERYKKEHVIEEIKCIFTGVI